MAQEELIPNPMRANPKQNGFKRSEGAPTSSPAAASSSTTSHVERLEYRKPDPAVHPGHENGHAEEAATGARSLVEEWLRPATAEQSAQTEATNPALMARLAEEQWRQERTTLESRLAEQNAAASRAIAAAREEGRREGRQISEDAFEEERGRMRLQMVEALEEFRLQRERYFHSVEREVVRLALAISARVLHRQAQIDPLFLSGAVRVALEKLADTTGVVLRVAPAQVLAWQEMFRLHSGARVQPEILGDLSLNAGECILETKLGTVELGVKAQLEEIEKGFFDLLHHHPASNRMANGLGA